MINQVFFTGKARKSNIWFVKKFQGERLKTKRENYTLIMGLYIISKPKICCINAVFHWGNFARVFSSTQLFNYVNKIIFQFQVKSGFWENL